MKQSLMLLITFLAFSYSKIKFLVSETHAEPRSTFPKAISGTFLMPMGWTLELKEDVFKMCNKGKQLCIEESLKNKLRIHKHAGYYLLEHVENGYSEIILIANSSPETIELYLPPQDIVPALEKCAIYDEHACDNDAIVLIANNDLMSSLIRNGFFSQSLRLTRI